VAHQPSLSDVGASAAADAVTALLDGGYLRFFTAPQPANANTPLSTQRQLAELRFSSPAFGPSVAGVAKANAIAPDTDADDTGTATWFRTYRSDGLTPVFDGSLGLTGADLVLNEVDIQAHAQVEVTAFTYVQAKI
jgi:hypothetical protein